MSASRLTPTLRVACKLLQVGSPSPNHWAPFEASLIRLQTSFRSVSCLHSSAGSLEGPIEGSYPPANVLLDPLLQEGWPADNQVSRYARSDSPSRHCITAPRSVLWQPELTPGPIIRSSVKPSIRPARTGVPWAPSLPRMVVAISASPARASRNRAPT